MSFFDPQFYVYKRAADIFVVQKYVVGICELYNWWCDGGWWMVVSGVLCSDCPLPGSIRVAAWITSSSGSRQRRRNHDGEMVRYDGPHTTLIGPRDQQLTAALLLLHISSYIHVYIILYLVPGHLSWDGHRRTCPSHALSLISNIFCQNWTNTFANFSYTV